MLRVAVLKPNRLVDFRDQAAVAMLLASGMRISAFLTLSIGRVHIAERTIKQVPALGCTPRDATPQSPLCCPFLSFWKL